MTQISSDVLTLFNTRLKDFLLRTVQKTGLYSTAIEGLRLSRREEIGNPEHCFDKPLVSIIIQGGKRAVFGSKNIQYSANQCLIVGMDMPNAFQVTAASPEAPFLAISLHLNKQLVAQLMTDIEIVSEPECDNFVGAFVADADVNLMDAFARLVELLDTPERIPVLAPMLLREIHYLLLTGPHGAQLRRINTFGTRSNQISRAIAWLQDNYTESLHIDALAHKVNMATSTFHRHFKEVTSLSPLQYLKRLRLYEAQRLMLMERHDANSAGFAVGYESTTQFNREYKRLFGEPPLRNIKHRH